MTLPNRACIETGYRKAKQVGNGADDVLSVRKPGRVMFKLVFIACVGLLCKCVYGAEPKVLDSATQEKVRNLVEDLHEAEAELAELVRKAEAENPELRKYKDRHEEITEWYWGKRLEGSGELASDLYGSAPDKKKERLRVYEEAKANAFLTYLLEPSESPEKEDLLKLWFSVEGSRNGFAEGHGMTISDPNNFFEEMKAHLKKHKSYFETSISEWRQKHEFITDLVWDRAYKSATGEFKMHALSMAVYKLTPQNVRDAEKKVGKITKELERTWPGWDEIHKESIASVNRIVEQASQTILNSGNSTADTSSIDINQIIQAPVTDEKPKPQANSLQPEETSNQWRRYGLPVLGAILGILIIAMFVRTRSK